VSQQLCYANGALIGIGQVRIDPRDGGLLRGEGVFETLLAIGGRVYDVNAHLERLRVGLGALRVSIPESDRDLETAIDRVAASVAGAARVRVTVTTGAPGGGPTRLIAAEPYEPPSPAQYRTGVVAVTARDLRLDSRRPLRQVKTTSYLAHRLIGQQAEVAGAWDAVVLNERDRVVEGGRANVAFRIDERWVTPALQDGCLPGTLRRRLLEQGAISEGAIDRAALVAASSAAFTNSLVGVLPIARLDGRPLRVGHSVAELRRCLPGPWSRP
jgi:branched-subunit amino acid aminotransferase/4-amino-4-deoxychorismate lyase